VTGSPMIEQLHPSGGTENVLRITFTIIPRYSLRLGPIRQRRQNSVPHAEGSNDGAARFFIDKRLRSMDNR
ncbi:MAG TPA: hypothetical protein VIR79_01215, partial [Nitrospira sp.]